MALSPLPENVLPSNTDTLLTISGLGGFRYSARGLSQTLNPIKQLQQQFRTINGNMRDFSNRAFRKYASEITCSDINAPPLDNLFPGDVVTVECAACLSYRTGNPGSPNKQEVSGSSWTLGPYTYYRPVLEMMVLDPNQGFDEWKSEYHWKISLEEV